MVLHQHRRRGLRLTIFGVVVGMALSALLAAVALFASWLPVRRAARVDPMQALR